MAVTQSSKCHVTTHQVDAMAFACQQKVNVQKLIVLTLHLLYVEVISVWTIWKIVKFLVHVSLVGMEDVLMTSVTVNQFSHVLTIFLSDAMEVVVSMTLVLVTPLTVLHKLVSDTLSRHLTCQAFRCPSGVCAPQLSSCPPYNGCPTNQTKVSIVTTFMTQVS